MSEQELPPDEALHDAVAARIEVNQPVTQAIRDEAAERGLSVGLVSSAYYRGEGRNKPPDLPDWDKTHGLATVSLRLAELVRLNIDPRSIPGLTSEQVERVQQAMDDYRQTNEPAT